MNFEDRLVLMPSLSSITIRDKMRFWAKTSRDNPNGCHLWTGSTSQGGSIHGPTTSYGCFKLQQQVYKAHRVGYFFHYREDPRDKRVLHDCDITLCVNPEHLKLGTHSDNMCEAYQKGRKWNTGNNAPGRFLSEDLVAWIRIEIASGMMEAEFVTKYGMHRSAYYRIKRRAAWK